MLENNNEWMMHNTQEWLHGYWQRQKMNVDNNQNKTNNRENGPRVELYSDCPLKKKHQILLDNWTEKTNRIDGQITKTISEN